MKNNKIDGLLETLTGGLHELATAFDHAFEELLDYTEQLKLVAAELSAPPPPPPAPALPLPPPPMGRTESGRARRTALLAGVSMYMGARCAKGHDGLRYTISASCVRCKRTHNGPIPLSVHDAVALKENYSRRVAALANKQRFFEPFRPCDDGHNQRYASNNQCVECARMSKLRRKEADL